MHDQYILYKQLNHVLVLSCRYLLSLKGGDIYGTSMGYIGDIYGISIFQLGIILLFNLA
jgi:hypothetical protein